MRRHGILIVEDDYLLAAELGATIQRAGNLLVGPAPSIDQALRLLQDGAVVDAAILDIHLRDEMVFPVADALTARGAPFLFITGHDSVVPERFIQAALCKKPLVPKQVRFELQRVLDPPWFVAIGASGADGLVDLCALLGALPAGLNAAFLVVLHRGWGVSSSLCKILARAGPHRVVVARPGIRLEPGRVYIGEPSRHLVLGRRSDSEVIDDPDRIHGGRTVDLLFHSVAGCAGARTIGVVLSGGLDDGSRGLAAIHQAGGRAMVVQAHSELGSGMPTHAMARVSGVNLVGTPSELAREIALITRGLAWPH
ncbi:MAG TPA: chemotaxis protein CheB [Kofleriaceae bacterium]